MKWILPAIVFAVGFGSAAYADCPEYATKRDCSDKGALQHVFKQHCSGKDNKSEFGESYCEKLEELCTGATTGGKPSDDEEGVCFTERKGEVVGWDAYGTPTSCYKTVFIQHGFGGWLLKTSYPLGAVREGWVQADKQPAATPPVSTDTAGSRLDDGRVAAVSRPVEGGDRP